MFLFIATITVAVLAADPGAATRDIFARLGMPKEETHEYRIHVGRDGAWTTHLTQTYSIKGVSADELHDFEEMLIEESRRDGRAQSFLCSGVSENRRQCVSKGKSDDALKLASLLVHVFYDDKCDFFRWDGETFEWKFLRDDDHSSLRDEKKTVGELVAGMVIGTLLEAAIIDELKQKNVTKAEFEAAVAQEFVKMQLVMTTDGKITADLPAKVSEDGKTMTLDLTMFFLDPPKKWSIRIDGL